jgi:CheY-like chemotaxis protein
MAPPECPPSVRRVLVVEDNPDSRETLELLLQGWGHEAQVAADGSEGLAKGLSWKPDVAIVDIGLPLLDGYEVAQRMRAQLGRDIFLIALTGYAQPEDRRRALASGFDVHMTKPADLDELARLVAMAH